VGNFSDIIVAQPGQYVVVTATADGATQGFYIPFRDLPTVDIEVVPDSTSYWMFQAPSTPGVYAAPNAEYDGPWFGQDMGALVVLPSGATPTLGPYISSGGEGDVYNPPVQPATGSYLVSDDEGLFNHSVPGPTLTAAAGPVSFQCEVPMSTIGIDNWLVNVTSNDPNGQQEWLAAHADTLPYSIGIYRVDVSGLDLVTIASQALAVGTPLTLTATLVAGVYEYGLVSPVAYTYDPDGQSSLMTGSQSGEIQALWGILWVGP